MVAGSLALTAQYAWWRITDTLPAPAYTFEYALALVFLVAELVGIVTAALSLLFLTRTRDRSPDADANAEWLSAQLQPPSIDVLICSYNEEREILERTIVGALGMDYPNFRVWMLDDSRRAWVRTLCDELGCRYLSRSDNAHAKAGNINHALKHIAGLPDAAGIRLDPRRRFRAHPAVPETRHVAVSRSHDWSRANAATFRQSRPDSDQSRGDQILARRAALLLRHRAPSQGCVVRRILLRHVFDRQDAAADADRRLSDGFGDRGLSA